MNKKKKLSLEEFVKTLQEYLAQYGSETNVYIYVPGDDPGMWLLESKEQISIDKDADLCIKIYE